MMESHSDSPIREELSQAKARLGVCIFALVYIASWSIFAETVTPVIVWVLLGYTAFSSGWVILVRLHPGQYVWRRILVIFTDLGINTFFMHILQAKGAFFYPMYLWIIVGNGMRYGPRYLVLAMVVSVAYYAPMLWLSPYWRLNWVTGSGLLAGLIVLPMFYRTLIRNLHDANRRLTQELARSQAAVQAKNTFLANMSHELRTPMSGILGVAELMRKTPLEPSQGEHLDLIQRCTSSLLTIIDDVLDFAKIEAGEIRLKHVPLNLRAILGDTCHLMEPVAKEKGLDLQLRLPDQAQWAFLGDPTRIRQILFNLLGNAVKFTERGRVVVDYHCEERDDDRSLIRVQVIDSGVGIPKDKWDQIFDRFERVESFALQHQRGSGLGLAISRHLARMMGGDITVHSEPGQGSTFTLTLPLVPRHDISPCHPRITPDVNASYSLSALVVEDNPVNSLVIRSLLEHLGASVAVEEDGLAALSRLGNQTFDVIFMDIRLPKLDGLETTRRIRAGEDEKEHVPIVALTANAFAEDHAACLEAGMDIYLRKPLQLSELQSTLESLEQSGLFRSADDARNSCAKRAGSFPDQ